MKFFLVLFFSVMFSFSHSELETDLPNGVAFYPGVERVVVLAQNSFHSDVEELFIERRDEHLLYVPIPNFDKKANSHFVYKKGTRKNTKIIFKNNFIQRSTFK